MTGARELGLLRGEESSQRATFLELFFDLVFVFALTRVSQRLIVDFSTDRRILPSEAGQTLLLFLALWLIWSSTALATSRLDPDHPAIQIVVVGSMLGAMIMALAVPGGFGARALVFAGAYVSVQVGRALFLWAIHRSGRGAAARTLIWAGTSAVPWLAGGIVAQGGIRGLLWTLGVVLDYTASAAGAPVPRLGRSRTTGVTIAAEHLAERYQQFLLIALGESILVIGLTFTGDGFAVDRIVSFLVSFLTTVLLWRIYFHRAGHVLPAALTSARDPARLGRAASLTHLLMIAGIVLCAVGYELSIARPFGQTVPAWLFAILGGPALFLVGRGLFEYQVFARVSRSRIVGLAALGLLAPALLHLQPVAVSGGAAAVLAGVAVNDALRSRGRPPERPAPPI
jgi:low temperature requirement protein LtrA